MDILHLTYFLEVATQKSFSKASETLHVSQPSISKAIHSLEEEWNFKLFHRAGRSITLTNEGEAILPQIKNFIDHFYQLQEQVSSVHNLERGNLAIGIPPMIGSTFLSPVIKGFLEQYPQIQLHLVEMGSTETAVDITRGRLQVGFVALPFASNIKSTHVKSYIFSHEPVQAVVRINDPLADRTSLSLKDIEKEPLVFFTPSFSLYHVILQQFQKEGLTPRVVAQSDNWDFISEMVKNGLGMALLPMHICQRLDRQYFSVIPLDPGIPWIIGMIWQDNHTLSTPTKLWLNYFKKSQPEIL